MSAGKNRCAIVGGSLEQVNLSTVADPEKIK